MIKSFFVHLKDRTLIEWFWDRALLFIMMALFAGVVGIGADFYVELNEPPGVDYALRRAEPGVVPQGGILHIDIDFRRTKLCKPQTERSLINSLGTETKVLVVAKPKDNPKPDEQSVDLDIPLSDFYPPGPAKLRTLVWWRCNWAQELVENWIRLPDVNFTVVEK